MSNFWSDLSKALGNDLTSLNGGKPSVITNLLKQRQWNANLTNLGGVASPLSEKASYSTVPSPTQAYVRPQQPVKAVKGAATKAVQPYMPSPTATPTPASYPIDLQSLEVNKNPYEQLTYDTFKKYQIPPAIAYGMAAAEGGTRNRFNIGAHDTNPTAAPVMDDLTSASAAAKMLSGQQPDKFYSHGAKGKKSFADAYGKRDNPEAMLKAIMDAGYAGDPKTWKKRSISEAKAAGGHGAGENFDYWDQFVKSVPAWKKWR